MHKNWMLFALVIGLQTGLWCQQLKFNNLTVNDGLSQHDVSSVIQDSEGFIWIGTYDGLNRFDGYEVETFLHDNNNPKSLSSNRIKCLLEDQHQRIWIGTDGYGLNYYSLEDGTISQVETPRQYRIINDIIQTAKNTFTVATSQGLLQIFFENDRPVVEVLQTPMTGFNVKHICKASNNKIFFATTNGIWEYHDNTYTFIENSRDNAFNSIIESTSGAIWIGGSSGLYQLEDQMLIPLQDFSNKNVMSIVEGIHQDLWISTFKNGLYNLNLNKAIPPATEIRALEENNQYILSNNILSSLYRDRTNTLWVSNKNGVFYTNLESKSFKRLPIVKKGHIRTLFSNTQYVFYGYQSDKFFRYSFLHNSNKVITLPEDAKPFRVDTLAGAVHLGTTRGLYKETEKNSGNFRLLPIFNDPNRDASVIVTSFTKDQHQNFFYGTFRGLIIKNAEKTGWIHEGYKNLSDLRDIRIFSLLSDPDLNCLWVGTISNGLIKVNFDDSGQLISAEKFNEDMVGTYRIPNNSIWAFYKTNSGNLYVGTDTGLLVKKTNQSSFESIAVEGIINKKIMGIVQDKDNNLWLNNSQGIIKYHPVKGEVTQFNYQDGLLTSTFTEAIARNNRDELFFGNISGINYFKQGELLTNPYSSEIALTKLLIDNKKVGVDDTYLGSKLLKKRLNKLEKLSLNYKQNDFSIEFSSTNYANIKSIRYRYKLDGYESQWNVVNSSKRYATYSNIPSGNYNLLIEASNPDGQWSNKLRSLAITMAPAPWNTWWAYALYFLFAVALITLILKSIMHREKLKSQIALSNLKNEKEKEINEMKLIFFTDVAHEFKTPLSLVIGPLNDLIKGNVSEEHKVFCYNIVSRNINRMMTLVNQLLDFRKIHSGVNILKVSRYDISAFIKEIAKSFEWRAQHTKIQFNIIAPESYYCHFDKDIVEKVMYNLLSNAFKYTPDHGIIEIELKPTWKQNLEYFIIVIKDSGKGIPQMDKKKIFQRHFHGKDRSSSGIGLHLTATLIEAHRGEITVLNSSLGGTEFMFSLPVSSKAFTEEEYLLKEDIPRYVPQDYVPGEPPKDIDHENDSLREKILLVEDDYDLRKYLANTLSNTYHVYEAKDGKEGLQIALNEIPDIIISDVMMPEMDGIELCRKIKAETSISHIPVLMLTAKTGEEFQFQGLEVGAWDYIPKPFDSTLLLQKVKNIIDTRNSFRKLLINDSDAAVNSHYVSYDQKFVKNTTALITERIADPDFSTALLAKELGLSRMQLHRKLKSLTGLNTSSFVNTIKIRVAVDMFDGGCDRVQEAMDAVGINSYSHFSALFKKEKGVTPSKYIEQLKETLSS